MPAGMDLPRPFEVRTSAFFRFSGFGFRAAGFGLAQPRAGFPNCMPPWGRTRARAFGSPGAPRDPSVTAEAPLAGSGLDDRKALAYNASKTALNAFTVHLAHALKHTPVKVNAAHPGSVATDMNPAGTLTVEVGARRAVQLATLAADGPSGGFFHLGQTLPW